jgi:glucokinase
LRKAILINGPPSSGKSHVAEQLVPLLAYPLFSIDTIKEMLFENLGTGDREFNRKLGRTALSIIMAIVRDLHEDAVVMIDAWFGSRAFNDLEGQLLQAKITHVVEIWCHAPGEILAERYIARVDDRHPGHPDESYANELIKVAQDATPLHIGPVLTIDTSEDVVMSPNEIAAWVQQVLEQKPA